MFLEAQMKYRRYKITLNELKIILALKYELYSSAVKSTIILLNMH